MEKKKIGYMEGLPKRGVAVIGRTMRDIFISKGFIFTLIVLLIPAFISILTLITPQDGFKEWWVLFILFGLVMYLQLLVLIFCLVYGSSMVNKDIDNRTMTYLLVRGAKRAEIYIWKYIATTLSLMIMFTLSILITYCILMTHGSFSKMIDKSDMFLSLLVSTFFGILLYTSLFSMLGTYFKRPLMIGLLYAFFWEVIMVNLLWNIADFTFMLYIRSIFAANNSVDRILEMENSSGLVTSIIVLLLFTIIFISIGASIISHKDIH
jgi:ABC-type transport system involved in multi-copper enzyme maturation permease subunit